MLIQSRIGLATRTPCAGMHSSTGQGRDSKSYDSEVLHRRDLRSACHKNPNWDTHGIFGNHTRAFFIGWEQRLPRCPDCGEKGPSPSLVEAG